MTNDLQNSEVREMLTVGCLHEVGVSRVFYSKRTAFGHVKLQCPVTKTLGSVLNDKGDTYECIALLYSGTQWHSKSEEYVCTALMGAQAP